MYQDSYRIILLAGFGLDSRHLVNKPKSDMTVTRHNNLCCFARCRRRNCDAGDRPVKRIYIVVARSEPCLQQLAAMRFEREFSETIATSPCCTSRITALVAGRNKRNDKHWWLQDPISRT